MVDELLPRRGTLFTFTVQGFRPKEPYAGPDAFEPFGVGYIELSGALLVEARLTENDPDRLRVGAPMELVIVPFGTDEHGEAMLTFAFGPVADDEAAS